MNSDWLLRVLYFDFSVAGICALVLFWHGFRHRMLSHYSLVYGYVAFAALAATLQLYIGVTFGIISAAYTTTFTIITLLDKIFAFFILAKIYMQFGKSGVRYEWHLLLAFSVGLVLLALEPSTMRPQWKVLNPTYFVLIYLGVATMFRMSRNRNLTLGGNLTAVLFAITVPLSLASALSFVYYFGNVFSYHSFVYLNEAAITAFWLILLFGLRCFSPPRRLSTSGLDPVEAKRRVQRNSELLAALWRH